MKKIYFLSGLPRSGSTLLGSMLAQNPSITVTPTSPMLDLMCYTNEALRRLNTQYTYDFKGFSDRVYKSLAESFYGMMGTDIVIDKHRGWPRNVEPASLFVSSSPKIICTYRPISEVITSYLTLICSQGQGGNFVDDAIVSEGGRVTTESRAKTLWHKYISDPYSSMVYGMKNHRKNIHLVSYSDLTSDPMGVIRGIFDFIGEPMWGGHDFLNIKNACAEEKDEAWGISGLHDIRPRLEKISKNPHDVLGAYLTSYFDQYNITS